MNTFLKNTTIFIALVSCAIIGKEEPKTTAENFDAHVYNWLQTFAQVISVAKKKAYELPQLDKAMIKSMDAFMNFDKHGTVLSPEELKMFNQATTGEFCGIGVALNPKGLSDDFVTIINVMPESPAEKAGVKPLDKIVAIDGKLMRKMSLEEVVSKIKGKKGTEVTLDILRDSNEKKIDLSSGQSSSINKQTIKIKRDIIKEDNTAFYYLPEQEIYYISFSIFSPQTANFFEKALEKALKNQACKGIVLDLRNNGGGVLQSAVDIAGLFLEKGSTVVMTKDREGKAIESYATKRSPIFKNNFPIICLVNCNSASATEILSGALQKLNSSKIIIAGTLTCGKGSVQELVPITNQCAMKCTISNYFLGDGTKVQGVGINPDVIVEQKYPPSSDIKWLEKLQRTEIEAKDEEEKKDENKSLKQKKLELLQADYQVQKAIDFINWIDNFAKHDKKATATKQKLIENLNKRMIMADKFVVEEIKI